MGCVYTAEQLLSLRHVAQTTKLSSDLPQVRSYFALLRKYNDLIKSSPRRVAPDSIVVRRYELATPNKEFKRRWIVAHGTTAGLSDLPRYPIRIFSVRVKFLEEHFKRCDRLMGTITRLYHNKVKHLVERRFVPAPQRARVREPERSHKAPSTTFPAGPVAAGFHTRDGIDFLSVKGGPTYQRRYPPPVDHWRKYWYFYRKRGRWYVSEHRPYGDEPLFLANRI